MALMADVADAQILKQEPPMGGLRHKQAGGTKDIKRTTSCIPRPK